MRTTLTIDDDLAGILHRQSRELEKSFKEVVNTAIRKGLAENLKEKKHTVVVRPHDFGSSRAGLDMDRLNQLVDELEVEDYLRKAAKDDSAGH
jgi:poly-D-alanine transfer protein DltD